LLFAGEKVKAEYSEAAPSLAELDKHELHKMVALHPLVIMKLTSFRLKDRVHLLDMIGVGLVDQSWLPRLPAELAKRLQELLDNPDG
jgi:hypothetical protein